MNIKRQNNQYHPNNINQTSITGNLINQICHPDGKGGYFLNYLIDQPLFSKSVLMSTAINFTGAKTSSEIIAIDPELFEVGRLILEKEGSLNYNELNEAVTVLFGLDYDPLNLTGELVEAWDSLFYQIIMANDDYALKAIQSLLLADHIVNHFGNIPANDSDLEKWLKSKITLPVIMRQVNLKTLQALN